MPESSSARFVIVTGAAAGIGLATVRLLLAAGWHVGAFDIDAARLDALQAEAADRIFPYRLDVADGDGWVAAAKAFGAWSGGRLDLLINNAGIIAVGRIQDMPLARARRMIDVNVTGVINGVHACLPLLIAAAPARIITVSSIAALAGWPYSSAYSASKSAVYNLTEALGAELAPLKIRVADVLPSFIRTELVAEDRDFASLYATFRAFSIAFTSPKRVARRIVDATVSNKVHHIVGRQAHVYAFVARYLPGVARMMSRAFGRRYMRLMDEARTDGASLSAPTRSDRRSEDRRD